MLESKRHILLIPFLASSLIFGKNYSGVSTIDKYGQEYDLSQKMSINMQDSSIKNVLMLIGELTGLNIVVTPEVTDTITANLENVSVKAALDVILIPNGYKLFGTSQYGNLLTDQNWQSDFIYISDNVYKNIKKNEKFKSFKNEQK